MLMLTLLKMNAKVARAILACARGVRKHRYHIVLLCFVILYRFPKTQYLIFFITSLDANIGVRSG